jgi:1-acyl-sn-glycerol-3-phosphate acyltransferase
MGASIRSIAYWVWVVFATTLTGAFLTLQFPFTALFDPQRRVGQWAARLWGKGLVYGNPTWHARVTGLENLGPGPYAVVSNHESNIDPLFILTLPLCVKPIGKKAVFRVPFMGWGAYAAGFVPLERGNEESIARTKAATEKWIEKGVSIMYFAEGGRSRDGTVGPFKKGAFELSLKTGAPVLPMTVSGTHKASPKGDWHFTEDVTLRLHVHPPENAREGEDLQAFANRVRDQIIARKEEMLAEHADG